MQKSKSTIVKLAGAGLMTALVFVASLISIPIPTVLDVTRIHLGNTFCILAGLLVGPWYGGAAAGIGSMFYDWTNPLYISSSPFTLINKFFIGFIAGKIAYAGGRQAKNIKWNFLAASAGSAAYIVLYLGKSFLEDVLFKRTEVATALIDIGTKSVSSIVNAVIAVIIAVPLAAALRKGLERAGLYEKFGA